MGSPLRPTLADTLMAAFEEEIFRPLFSCDTLKFYTRYVDDTFVQTKPNLNSFYAKIKFTHKEFTDNNDIHFLDIKITSTLLNLNKATVLSQIIILNNCLITDIAKQWSLLKKLFVYIRHKTDV